jgi:hypothetical protein
MAYLVPAIDPGHGLSSKHDKELETLAVLRQQLPSEYTVFHSVHWSLTAADRGRVGELDFIIVNQSGDILLIEQKNGAISETGGELSKSYDGDHRNVGAQLHRSLDAIRDKLKKLHGTNVPVRYEYLLYFPDHRLKSLNAIGLESTRIVDAPERSNLAKHIQRILPIGNPQASEWRERILAFFEDQFCVVPDIHASVTQSEKVFRRLSGTLAEIISNIEMTPLRLRILGTAGCGKSHVAQRCFQQALNKGVRPLLLCFTRPLREKLNALAPRGGMVQTFLGFCSEFLNSIGEQPDFGSQKLGPEFWRAVLDRVSAAEIGPDWKFGFIIVDEGQDFEPEWYEILRLFLQPGGGVVWLEDKDQNVFMKPSVALDDFVNYRANCNYRSPLSIARYIRRALPIQFDYGNDVEGQGVTLERYGKPEDQVGAVARAVSKLLKDGFRYDQIVVLSCRGVGNSALSNLAKVGLHTVRTFQDRYDLFGNQIMSDGNLTIETIRRFKGQQEAAVLVTDLDPNPGDELRAQRLLFCAMTRATLKLHIFARAGNPFCDALPSAP